MEKHPGKIIGLTGTYCAGKNHVAKLLEERGFPVLDVDKLGHGALETEKEAIRSRFGEAVLGADGAVDRRLLGAKVFGKNEELAALEAIVHPAANRMTMEWIEARGGKPCVINAALLHRSAVFPHLDAIIIVKAPVLTRLLRARKRDHLSWIALIKRFGSQKNFISQYFDKTLKYNADIYTVENRGFSQRRLKTRIDRILSSEGMVP
ncbi:dephospho-CoA kinase [Spirochaetia bacterium]|nr:dephospho-CoA kinase [Spirochaetia bacterium]